MEKEIVVVDADRVQCQRLCEMLEGWHYRAVPKYSLKGLEAHIAKSECISVILDIDTVKVDNQTIGELVRKNPGIYFFGMSKARFHPELQEAISSYFYAFLAKPVGSDELSYWLNSISENDERA